MGPGSHIDFLACAGTEGGEAGRGHVPLPQFLKKKYIYIYKVGKKKF
jgi:hypothetical protein